MHTYQKVSKIIRVISIYVLAFFVLNAQDVCPAQNTALRYLARTSNGVKLLENGLRIIIEEDHRNPIVVFSVFIDVGAAQEGEYLGSGISHLIEHMLFKGTKKYPKSTIEDILHKYGGRIEAFTSHEYTGFRVAIVKEHIDIAIDVLKEILTMPLFDAKELEKEKQVIEREMSLSKDDPVTRVFMATFSSAYMAHPYRIPVIGYRENLKRLDRNDVVKFFKSNYIPEKIVIAVVGDMDGDTVRSQIERTFGGLHRGRNLIPPLSQEREQLVEKYVEEKMDVDGVYLNIAFHSTSLFNDDMYALDLLSFILAQGESSILNEKVRIEKQLAMSIFSYNYTPKDPGLFIISSIVKEDAVKDAVDEIMAQIEILKEKGVTEKQLIKARENFLADYIYEKETLESRANDLAIGELLAGSPRFFEAYIGRIKSVTVGDIQNVAKKYFTRKNMTVVALSRSGNRLPFSSEFLMQEGGRNLNKITLKNNLPVIVCSYPSLPILSISLVFKAGLRLETEENNGISHLTSLMLMDGIDTMSRKEIAWFYESKGMSINTYSGNNSIGITVKCLKEHIEDAMRLVSSLCMRSTFPEVELEREKREIEFRIDTQDNQIFNHGHRVLKELLFKTHPYRYQIIGTHDSIAKIDREDVVRFYNSIFSAENMALGISGDCDFNEIEPLLEKYFVDIPSGKGNFTTPLKEQPMDKKRHLLIDVDKEESLVLYGFHALDIYSKDRFNVEVLVDILSRESGVLFKSIRGEKGLSYSTGAFQVIGIERGYIVIYALTSKKNIGKVKGAINKEIQLLIKNSISSEEIERSKNHLKAMNRMANETNSHFIFTVSMDELYGLGYNSYKEYDKNIDGVTKLDVERVAMEILTLDRCVEVILQGRE